MTDTVDVEACVRLLDDLIRTLAPHDAQSIADAFQLCALRAALPGMGKDSGFTQKDVDNLRAMPDGTGYASIDDPEWFESLIARVAARAAQPQETSDDAT